MLKLYKQKFEFLKDVQTTFLRECRNAGHVKYRCRIIGKLISIKVLWKLFYPKNPIKDELSKLHLSSYIILPYHPSSLFFLTILPCHPFLPSFLTITFMFYLWFGQFFADLLSKGLDSSLPSLYHQASYFGSPDDVFSSSYWEWLT